MLKKVISALFLILSAVIAFLLGLIFTARSMSKDVIELLPNGKKTSFEVELVDPSKKVLVPTGQITSDNETDVVELKFKFEIKKNSKEYILMSSIDSIVDQDNNKIDINKYFSIKVPNKPLINRSSLYIIEVRLKMPETQEDYNFITSRHFKINLSFWVEEPK